MALDEFDAAPAYSFSCEVDSTEIKSITEVSGLKMESDVIELKMNTSDGKYVIRKYPGREKPADITLTRHYDGAKGFSDWLEKVGMGNVKGSRRSGFINLKDAEGNTLKRFQFINGFAKSLEFANLKAGGTEPITEKIVISCEGVKLVS